MYFLFFIFCCCGSVFFVVVVSFLFIFSNVFFIFLILFYFLFFVIDLLFFVCCLSVYFLPCCCSLLGLGSQARGQAWAPVVEVLSPSHWTNREPQTPGNINQCELSQGSQFGTKTQLHPTACKLQCWRPQAKQPGRQEHNLSHFKKWDDKKYVTDKGAR